MDSVNFIDFVVWCGAMATAREVMQRVDETQDTFADLSDEERAILRRVADVLRKLSFGTVLLVVQDRKVVQIEMAEKFRLR